MLLSYILLDCNVGDIMNILFVELANFSCDKKKENKEADIVEEKQTFRQKLQRIKENISKITLVEDDIKKGFNENAMCLKIDEDFLKKKSENKRFSMKLFLLRKRLQFLFLINHVKELKIIFSSRIDQYPQLKEWLNLYVFSSLKKVHIEEIIAENTMLLHSLNYVENYVRAQKIEKNKLKILLAFNAIEDYPNEQVLEYIKQYKFVDILRMSGINKIDYKRLSSFVNGINLEYGSTIDIIQNRDIQQYHICVVFSNIDKNMFLTHYRLHPKAFYLDLKNPELDILGKDYISYTKNKYDLETVCNRLGTKMQYYSKVKLGHLAREDENNQYYDYQSRPILDR